MAGCQKKDHIIIWLYVFISWGNPVGCRLSVCLSENHISSGCTWLSTVVSLHELDSPKRRSTKKTRLIWLSNSPIVGQRLISPPHQSSSTWWLSRGMGGFRWTRQECPLLTGDSKSTNESVPSLVGIVVPVLEIFVLPWLLYSDQYKIFFFLTVHYFNAIIPIAQQAGQAVVLGHMSLSICLWVAYWWS
jgi:hypothetical protein